MLLRKLTGIVFLVVFYGVSFICCAPIEHKRKPLSKKQRIQNKKMGGVLSVVYSITAILLYNKTRSVSVSIGMTMVCVALYMIIL